MKNINLTVIIMIILIILVGCAGVKGKIDYTPPLEVKEQKNSKVVPHSKDEAWKAMIDGISESFFAINNIEKDSGLINLSYSGDPCRYIDCGSGKSTVSDLHGERNYSFPPCAKAGEYEFVKQSILLRIKRKIDLEGRANIFLSETNGGTLVKVNVRYIVTRNWKVYDSVGNLFLQASSERFWHHLYFHPYRQV